MSPGIEVVCAGEVTVIVDEAPGPVAVTVVVDVPPLVTVFVTVCVALPLPEHPANAPIEPSVAPPTTKPASFKNSRLDISLFFSFTFLSGIFDSFLPPSIEIIRTIN